MSKRRRLTTGKDYGTGTAHEGAFRRTYRVYITFTWLGTVRRDEDLGFMRSKADAKRMLAGRVRELKASGATSIKGRVVLQRGQQNPARKTVSLRNFSGTVTRNADGTVSVKGRKK